MEDNRTKTELLAEIASLREKLYEGKGALADGSGASGQMDAGCKALNNSLQLQISRHVRSDEIIHKILEVTSTVAGEEFMCTLVRQLASSLEMRYVFIGELLDEHRARTLAFWANGMFADNFEYALKGTPCKEVQK
ncbi:MAG: hypothetical protein HYV23_06760, partial [Deltaproteobacteria bacterium]|nr:hypothetical protein [Deltaproteobacteria bacterium]